MLIKRHRKHQQMPLNTVATADLSFVLLIFFLVTTSMGTDKSLNQPLPQDSEKTEERVVNKEEAVLLHIDANNQVLLNEEPIAPSKLNDILVAVLKQKGDKHVIVLTTDETADYATYFQLQNALALAAKKLPFALHISEQDLNTATP